MDDEVQLEKDRLLLEEFERVKAADFRDALNPYLLDSVGLARLRLEQAEKARLVRDEDARKAELERLARDALL